MAKNLGISYQTMWLIETGRHIPGDEIKEKLSAYYGIPVSYLFYGEKVNGGAGNLTDFERGQT